MLILLIKVEHYKTEKCIITYKNGKRNLTFGDIETEKNIFYCYKSAIF